MQFSINDPYSHLKDNMDTFCQTFINKFHSIDIKLPHRDETVDTGLLFYLNSREKILKSFDFNT